MFSEENKISVLGYRIGYITSYILFSTILFFILSLLNKLPKSWNYYYILGLVLFIALIGEGVKRILK